MIKKNHYFNDKNCNNLFVKLIRNYKKKIVIIVRVFSLQLIVERLYGAKMFYPHKSENSGYA